MELGTYENERRSGDRLRRCRKWSLLPHSPATLTFRARREVTSSPRQTLRRDMTCDNVSTATVIALCHTLHERTHTARHTNGREALPSLRHSMGLRLLWQVPDRSGRRGGAIVAHQINYARWRSSTSPAFTSPLRAASDAYFRAEPPAPSCHPPRRVDGSSQSLQSAT